MTNLIKSWVTKTGEYGTDEILTFDRNLLTDQEWEEVSNMHESERILFIKNLIKVNDKELKVGDTYFLETLEEHFGHKVVIARFVDAYTLKVVDYRLMCEEPECESPVGICAEVVNLDDRVHDVSMVYREE